MAKLKPDSTFEQAHSEMQTIYARLARQYPGRLRRQKLRLAMLNEKLVRDGRVALYVLLGAVGFVLLVACANTANLLLAGVSKRGREIAIRTALGATRSRLVAQFLAESTVVAVAGGIRGLILARWGTALLIQAGPQAIPRLAETTIDGATNSACYKGKSS